MKKQNIINALDQYSDLKVKVGFADLDGVLRGKLMHRDKFESALKKGFGFCDVVFGWDIGDEAYDNAQLTGWHTGYPDAPARLDPSTFRRIPWEDGMAFVLGDFAEADGSGAHPACPRSLLRRVRQQAKEMGYEVQAAQEFEWFNFAETPDSLAQKHGQRPQPVTPGMFGYSLLRSSLKSSFFHALFDQLSEFDIPLEGLHTETGPGVYEAAIQVSELLEAADRAVLFKTAVKEIAYRHELVASFMAKWDPDLPGCSGHIHQSLWKKGSNAFHDESSDQKMSDTMRHYIAGQLHCLPHILPFFAPTINSYKRLHGKAWAPNTCTWGIDNRTVALRALPGGSSSSRLETRVPGSDTNPYLALAAAVASGLYGIRHKLPLKTPRVTGNGYEFPGAQPLPRTLAEATAAMQKSDVAAELFGKTFVEHFARSREWEVRRYQQTVTDWERRRYFELV